MSIEIARVETIIVGREQHGERARDLAIDTKVVGQRGIWDPRELVEIGRCAICSSVARRCVAIRQDGLPIQECLVCGLAYVDPRPSSDQLVRYYDDGYFAGEKDFFRGRNYCVERDRAILRKDLSGYREIVSHFDLEDKTILDVGCASGALLCSLREHGPKELVGIDTVDHPLSFGREKYKLDLRRASLKSANLPAQHFDLITMIDVIEHVEDLPGFLRTLRSIIRPTGHVFLVTPNYGSLPFAQSEWSCLHKDFEHLQYFTVASLGTAFSEAGFAIVESWTDSCPSRAYQYPRCYKSGLHRLVHPYVAFKNRRAQNRYNRSIKKDLFLGMNLNVILRAASVLSAKQKSVPVGCMRGLYARG